MSKFQICNTETFLALALAADRAEYNRRLDVRKLNRTLDPNGIHICKFSMLHEHIAGRKVEPHIRSIWLLKMKNKSSTEPIEVALDISMESFNKLEVHDTEKVRVK
jgi:hypothetical protein